MKYKQLKEITPEAIYLAQSDKGCRDFQQDFDDFLDWVNSNFFEEISLDVLSKTFDKRPKWRDFLIKHGFIEEEQEERYFKVGAEFVSEGQYEYLLIYDYSIGYRMVCTLDRILGPHLLEGVIEWDGPSDSIPFSAIQKLYPTLRPKE